MSVNLGQVAAILYGTTAPTNTNVIWGETDTNDPLTRQVLNFKVYNNNDEVWELIVDVAALVAAIAINTGSINTLANLLTQKSNYSPQDADFDPEFGQSYMADTTAADIYVSLPETDVEQKGMAIGIHIGTGAHKITVVAADGADVGPALLFEILNPEEFHIFISDGINWKVYIAGSGSGTSETAATVKTKYESNANTNAFTDAEKTKLTGIATAATANAADATLLARANHTGTQSADSITDGSTNKAYTGTEKTKLAAIEYGATADMTDAEIKAAYEANANTNAFTDAEKAKLAAIVATAIATISATTYTLLSGDNGKRLLFTHASGCTVTVPTGLPALFNCVLIKKAAGNVVISPAATVTLQAEGLNLTVLHTGADVFHDGSNVFTLMGRLS